MKKNPTKQNVINALDEMFTPDIRIKVTGSDSIIIACEALTYFGAIYLLHNSILEKSYDSLDIKELCFEIVE